MKKFALLIGVSEYESGLGSLPSAIRDIQAVKTVLTHPEMGGFQAENITVLENPVRQTMEESIEILFSQCQKDDLALLFFSGHGIKDDTGNLYLSSHRTRKNNDGGLIRTTSVSAKFIQETMNRCRANRQVVILDCCFSGAFIRGMLAKDDGVVDIKGQLGGEGRVILTSSSSTQYSFEENGDDLSIYTKYLVEGIETGIADEDNDGKIAANELHDYVKRKVQESAPSMKPEFYPFQDGFKIYLANAPANSSELQYRRRVEKWIADRGEISCIARADLDTVRIALKLREERAYLIEQDVLSPYRTRRQNLTKYEYAFLEAIQRCNPLDEVSREDLRQFQDSLGLSNNEIQCLESRILDLQKKFSSLDVEEPQLSNSIAQKVIVHSDTDTGKNILDSTQFIGDESTGECKQVESSVTGSVLTMRRMANKAVSTLFSTRGLVGIGILVTVGASATFLFINDKKAEEQWTQAVEHEQNKDFGKCITQVNDLQIYTHDSPSWLQFRLPRSEDISSLLKRCNDSFQKERSHINEAQLIVGSLGISADNYLSSLETAITALQNVSSSELREEVEKLSNDILDKLKLTYETQEKFDDVSRLLKSLPKWTDAYDMGSEWLKTEAPQRADNVDRQTRADEAIAKVRIFLDGPYTTDGLQTARENLKTAREQLSQFPTYDLNEVWQDFVNGIEIRLNEVTAKVDALESKYDDCKFQSESASGGNVQAINSILFLNPNLRNECQQVGISLPTENDLRSIVDANNSLCEVIANGLNFRLKPGSDQEKVGQTLQSGMVLERLGKDFDQYENGGESGEQSHWIRVSDGGQESSWVSIMGEEGQYIDSCLSEEEIQEAKDLKEKQGWHFLLRPFQHLGSRSD